MLQLLYINFFLMDLITKFWHSQWIVSAVPKSNVCKDKNDIFRGKTVIVEVIITTKQMVQNDSK